MKFGVFAPFWLLTTLTTLISREKLSKELGEKNLEITEHVTVLNLTNLISQEKWTKKLGLKTRDNVGVLIDNFDFTRKKNVKLSI